MKTKILSRENTPIWKSILFAIIFFALIVLFLMAISFLSSPRLVSVNATNGAVDLRGLDLENQVVLIMPDNFQYYPEQLLFPEDFAGDKQPESRTFSSEDKTQIQYGSYRMTVLLPVGETYACFTNAINYAQRTFINSKEQESIGHPSSSAETMIPSAHTAVFAFTPQEDETEMLFQYSNFVHREGGEAYPIIISLYQNVSRYIVASNFRTSVMASCMFTIFIFYCGMYMLFGRRKYYLAFSVFCLAISVRTLVVGDKLIMWLLPEANWYIMLAAEYISLICTIVFFLIYLQWMFPDLFDKRVMLFYYAACGVYALVVIFTKPVFFTQLLWPYHAVGGLYGVYVIVRLLKNLKYHDLESLLVLVGGGLFVAGSILEIYLHGRMAQTRLVAPMQLSVILLIFAQMMALALRFSRTEQQLLQVRGQNRMKTEFLQTVGHEMKTPLAVINGYLELSIVREKKKAEPDEKNIENLTRALSEGTRAAFMTKRIFDAALIEAGRLEWTFERVDVKNLTVEIQENYFTMLNKSDNTLKLEIPENLPDVSADREHILRVLVNLIQNAVSFTRYGTITLAAKETGDFVEIAVSDTGAGISPELIPHIFERYETGVRGRGTGLGLYICKETIEGHGGTISLQSQLGSGTRVNFTLPVWKGDNNA